MQVKTRNSNLELLRIISMIFIIFYHFLVHKIIPNNLDYDYLLKPVITVLHIGVICFVLISGYWGINFKIKGLLNLFIQCSFYSVLIYIVASIINPSIFSTADLFKAILPFQWWYIQIYLCLYLLAPLINKILNHSSRKEKLFHIAILALISNVIGFYVPSLNDGKNPINFILIYYVGHYLKFHFDTATTLKTLRNYYLLYTVASVGILIMLARIVSFRDFLFWNVLFSYNTMGLLFSASLFFLIFTKLEFTSKFINSVASSVLAAYLIHENDYLSKYLYTFVGDLQGYINQPFYYSIIIVALAVMVFACCILIDKICNPVIKFLVQSISNLSFIQKLDTKITNL